MKVIEKNIDTDGTRYVVELASGFAVEVKVSAECGTTYVMQNHDGSTVFRPNDSDITFPGYQYDENTVISMVKGIEESVTNCELGLYDCESCCANGNCLRQCDNDRAAYEQMKSLLGWPDEEA